MSLPKFDLAAEFAKRVKYIGELPCHSTQKIAVRGVKQEDDRLVVVCAQNHNFQKGQKVYIANVSPLVNGSCLVSDLDETSKSAFYIEIPLSKPLSEPIVTNSGTVHAEQVFNVIDPDHLPASLGLERQALEVERLKVMSLVAPDKYRAAVDAAKRRILGKMDTQAYLDTVAELFVQHKLEAPAELMNAIALLFLQSDVEKHVDEEVLLTPDEIDDTDADVLKRIAELNHDIAKREVEILCDMPAGHMSLLDGQSNALALVQSVNKFVLNCIVEERRKQAKEEQENQVAAAQADGYKGDSDPKGLAAEPAPSSPPRSKKAKATKKLGSSTKIKKG